jgi:hypothetical protein
MARTAGQVLTRIRAHIEEPSAGYWQDSEVYSAMSNAQDKLYQKVTQLRDNYFISSLSPEAVVLVAGQTLYTLNSDVFRIKSIRCTSSGDQYITWLWRPFSDPSFKEALRTDVTVSSPYEFYFDLLNFNTMVVAPIPQRPITISIDYVGFPTEVAMSTDTFAFPDAFINYVEFAATSELLAKGPVGDASFWEDKAESEWKAIMLTIGSPRQDNNPDIVGGMFADSADM